jgi:hypothetical protein
MGLWAATACTTDLDMLVDDGVDDGGPSHTDSPDGAIDQFPPPFMEPTVTDPDPIVDPAGAFAFTLLHGVVDTPRIFFCLANNGQAQGDPWPEQGLGFGEAWVSDELPEGDPEVDSLQIIVIGADADLIDSRDCEAILDDPRTAVTLGGVGSALTRRVGPAALALADAGSSDAGLMDAGLLDAGLPDAGSDAAVVGSSGDAAIGSGVDSGAIQDAAAADAAAEIPPAIRAAFLPMVPAGTMRNVGSYLLTVAGCLGGFSHPEDRAVCGSSYFPDRPTLRPMLVRMSRLVTFGNPSLQFLQASLGAGIVTLRSTPGILNNGTQITIATDVAPGVIDPYPPVQSVAPGTFGDPLGVGGLELTSEIGQTWSDSWGSALAALDIEALAGLTGYTLVFVGPNPWLEDDAQWWNEPRFTMVRNSPE